MKKEEQENKLEKISERQYQELLMRNIKVHRDNLRDAEDELQESIDSYSRFLYDKNNYRLEFYKEGDKRYIYKRFEKKIGFKK